MSVLVATGWVLESLTRIQNTAWITSWISSTKCTMETNTILPGKISTTINFLSLTVGMSLPLRESWILPINATLKSHSVLQILSKQTKFFFSDLEITLTIPNSP